MTIQNEVARLVSMFEKSVAEQTDAIRRGDSQAGNEHANLYIGAFQRLRELGDIGREALTVLFSHPRNDVRVMAASFLLRYRTLDALEVLRKEADGEGITAFGASQAIKRWEDHSWNLDPES